MHNDSIDTLLLRHYGSRTPSGLEQQLIASVHRESRALQQQPRTRRVSRRHAVRLVAIGSAGIGLLSAGLESLQELEAALTGQDTTQARPAFS